MDLSTEVNNLGKKIDKRSRRNFLNCFLIFFKVSITVESYLVLNCFLMLLIYLSKGLLRKKPQIVLATV